MKKKNLYKKYKINPSRAMPGDLIRAARNAQSTRPFAGTTPKLSMTNPRSSMFDFMGNVKPSDIGLKNSPILKKKHGKKSRKTVKISFQKGNYKEGEEIKAINALHEMHQGKKKSASMKCKVCGKMHGKGMKHKALKLNPPSKGHKPKGAHGRAAVRALGRTKTTGNFARIEAKSGRGAAINAYQNALRAHKGK